MAGSKKRIRQKMQPEGKVIVQGGNPAEYYDKFPSWSFSDCDLEKWSVQSDGVHTVFWNEIFPRFQEWERQKWSDILVKAKKQNHSIDTGALNKVASDRLTELCIEAASLISLRLNGAHRIYGYMEGAVFHVLWIDLNHGDNRECVCRSYKKHT